jgi:hypothetical protein
MKAALEKMNDAVWHKRDLDTDPRGAIVADCRHIEPRYPSPSKDVN